MRRLVILAVVFFWRRGRTPAWSAFNSVIVPWLLPYRGTRVTCREGETTAQWTRHSRESPVGSPKERLQRSNVLSTLGTLGEFRKPRVPRVDFSGYKHSVQRADLRHTCATLFFSKGVHPKIVQQVLGYSSITITLDTYSRVLPNIQEKAVEAMEDILDGKD